MEVSVSAIAELVGGTVVGDGDQIITGISSLVEAGPGDVSFLANPRYEALIDETKASAVLVANELHGKSVCQIVVANPDFAFAKVVEVYGPRPLAQGPGVHPTAVVGDGVVLGEGITVGPYAVVGGGAVLGAGSVIHAHAFVGAEAVLGANCTVHPHVTIREACVLGDRVIVHSGAVIGSDGFGYASVEGVHHKIPQVGIVVVGNDVEIGANTTIDRARFGKTVIGAGSKIDNLVQIAHNVEIGEHCIVVAQVGIAGSTTLGRYVTMAGQSGAGGHLHIGDQTVVAARGGVTKNLPARSVVAGMPARDAKTHQKEEIASRRLPGLQTTIKDLVARVAELESKLASETDGGAA